jgi:hypothetical protein
MVASGKSRQASQVNPVLGDVINPRKRSSCCGGPMGCGDPESSIDAGRPSHDLFGFRQGLRPVVRVGLRVADGLRQHLTEFSLRLGQFPLARFLPVSHAPYMGMLEANATVRSGFRISVGPTEVERSKRESTEKTPVPLRQLSLMIDDLIGSAMYLGLRCPASCSAVRTARGGKKEPRGR